MTILIERFLDGKDIYSIQENIPLILQRYKKSVMREIKRDKNKIKNTPPVLQ